MPRVKIAGLAAPGGTASELATPDIDRRGHGGQRQAACSNG